MVVNLQFFGGRGTTSGLNTIRQITVNMDGSKATYRSEKGKTTKLNTNEKKMLEKIKKVWYDYLGRR